MNVKECADLCKLNQNNSSQITFGSTPGKTKEIICPSVYMSPLALRNLCQCFGPSLLYGPQMWE